MTANAPSIVWFRRDLRLKDNPAFTAAAKRGPVIPVFIYSEEDEMGAASKWWLHDSLLSLTSDLKKQYGLTLVIRSGTYLQEIEKLLTETCADAVFYNRRYEPQQIQIEKLISKTLSKKNILEGSFNANLLEDPNKLKNKTGGVYKVFTPYWQARLAQMPNLTEAVAPKNITAFEKAVNSLQVSDLNLKPKIKWDSAFYDEWDVGEAGAWSRLKAFSKTVNAYHHDRDIPSVDGTSRLSPHLHFGEISPRQIWNFMNASLPFQSTGPYLREIAWREFSHYLLFHFPEMPHKALKPQFDKIPWENNPEGLRAWQRGRTGYPIVDAGMRQLWQTGWMHNRVRMIVASFLIKDLIIDWREGAAWFWDTLVDADLANNTQGWQWTAGSGADAAPFFRIFNPVLQGEKFDPNGTYLKKWVPELSNLDKKNIHQPWNAPAIALKLAGVRLGDNYPERIVFHETARMRALKIYEQIKG